MQGIRRFNRFLLLTTLDIILIGEKLKKMDLFPMHNAIYACTYAASYLFMQIPACGWVRHLSPDFFGNIYLQ